MKVKAFSVMLIFVCAFSLFACKPTVITETTKEENTSEETTLAEESTSAEDVTVIMPKVEFSAARAKRIGTFDSDIYGKMILYLQDGYFLIFNEFESHILTISAQDYSPAGGSKNRVISSDMNFDGKTDFGVCYYSDDLNSYYFCFLWNSENKTYDYFLPLSSVANPEFIRSTATVIERKNITFTEYTENRYRINDSGLSLISSNSFTQEITTGENLGNVIADPEFEYMENGNSALLSVKSENDNMKWDCFIENTGIISEASATCDDMTKTYEFLLSSVTQGSTTVILRYKVSATDEVIQEINLNLIVDSEGNVKVIVP